MARSTSAAALTVVLLATVAACGPFLSRDREDPFGGGAPGASQVTILVQNFNREDVNVEVAFASGRDDLGRVSSRGRGQFTVDWSRAQELRFRINLVAGSRHTIRVGLVSPGDQVELVVTDPIARSYARRR